MRLGAAVLAALVAGVALGLIVARAYESESGRPAAIRGEGVLRDLPPGPVDVRFETVRLGAGFTSRHRHGGPTFNVVVSGRVEISDEDGRRVFGPGDSFFEPGGRPHSIRVLDSARLDVVRVLPKGAEETTELP